MKKNQKILIGLMALGLLGGVGTTFALTRTAATQQTINGQATDGAVYLYWGTNEQNTSTVAEVKDLAANTAQYRCVTVAPKVSKTVTGKVSVTFTLSTTETTALPGLTIGIYSVDKYTTEASDVSGSALSTLDATTKTSYTATFDVGGENNLTPTKYYTLVFTWDGSAVSDTNKSFGGSLKISQTFEETTSSGEETNKDSTSNA